MRSGFGRVFALELLRVAPGKASSERFIARAKGLAGSADEMRAGMARDGHNLARPQLLPPIVAQANRT